MGFALGPIIGGLLLAHFWWGSVFLINVPIAVVGLLCALPLVPDSKNPAALRPDLAGAVLSIAGLGLVLWSIIEAPVYGWSSAWVIGAGIGGLAVLVGFAAWERASSHPMLNLRFFQAAEFLCADRLAWPGDVRPGRSAVRADPVPPVQPGLLRRFRPGCGCCRSRPGSR